MILGKASRHEIKVQPRCIVWSDNIQMEKSTQACDGEK